MKENKKYVQLAEQNIENDYQQAAQICLSDLWPKLIKHLFSLLPITILIKFIYNGRPGIPCSKDIPGRPSSNILK